MFVSTKSYFNYSCAHRQWRHPGHCAQIHGYDRSFHFYFAAKYLTETGFVMDFGQLKWLKTLLDEKFDHTLLINEDDPMLLTFELLQAGGAAKLVTLPNIGMEGTSRWLWSQVNDYIHKKESGRVCCFKVETREHEKNSAFYELWPDWFLPAEAK